MCPLEVAIAATVKSSCPIISRVPKVSISRLPDIGFAAVARHLTISSFILKVTSPIFRLLPIHLCSSHGLQPSIHKLHLQRNKDSFRQLFFQFPDGLLGFQY